MRRLGVVLALQMRRLGAQCMTTGGTPSPATSSSEQVRLLVLARQEERRHEGQHHQDPGHPEGVGEGRRRVRETGCHGRRATDRVGQRGVEGRRHRGLGQLGGVEVGGEDHRDHCDADRAPDLLVDVEQGRATGHLVGLERLQRRGEQRHHRAAHAEAQHEQLGDQQGVGRVLGDLGQPEHADDDHHQPDRHDAADRHRSLSVPAIGIVSIAPMPCAATSRPAIRADSPRICWK